ncbi:metal-dependent hydrolase [Cellulomonas bogoriensis]|uniref:Hydrolase n=1 Tax=Cellulomonas bogoriensis 69B4 = DSM 16987 TaxID=1386082 RepID=A0A0A0C0D7_9CELL|nr:metal-dependent hydrolase [Cellulomonas bogoriensis]KGM12874.1 hydrolase [Cellulomonas bogoriensis 69B4 = DSM 16987]
MMGTNHAMSGAAAWVAVTSTVPLAAGLAPMPAHLVVIGAFVTAGAALLPDVDHHNGTIARSAGGLSRRVSAAARALAGGHRRGMHSLVGVLGFALGAVALRTWVVDVPWWGPVPLGSALLLVILLTFAIMALKLSRGVKAEIWVASVVLVAALLHFFPDELTWLPLAVVVGVVVHLAGDMATVGGVPLLWPFTPCPPRAWRRIPVLSLVWLPNGHLAIPVLGRTGSVREWVLFLTLTWYTGYVVAATTGLIRVAV